MAPGRRSLGQRAIEPRASVTGAAKAHLRPGERPVAELSTRSPQRAMADALGAAAGDAIGAAAGTVIGAATAVVREAAAAHLSRMGGGEGVSDPNRRRQLESAGEVLLVLSTERLLALTPAGDRVLASMAGEEIVAVTIEPSKVSPTNAVLAVRVEGWDQPLRLEGARGSALAFADALSSSLGPALEHRRADGWFLLKAAPVGLLLTFGVACLLLIGPVAADGGAGPGLQVGAMGAVGVAGGEALRRLLFGRRPRN